MPSSSGALGRKHLSVLNHTGPSSPSHFLLEDPGADPERELDTNVSLEQVVIDGLKTVYDPEIPLNIYDLGLVYRVAVDDQRHVHIAMSLTSPGCPVADVLIRQVHEVVRKLRGVVFVRTELVWDPPWTKDRMSDAAKLALGLL